MLSMSTKSNCPLCDKSYTRKTSLDKHILCCTFLNKSKKDKNIDEEEHANMPSYKELVTIVQEIAAKMKKLEQKMEIMEKWVDVKKKKINVMQWLGLNIIPLTIFSLWATDIEVTPKHLKYLLDNTIIDTVTLIFQHYITQTTNLIQINPIHSFDQKQNVFYIFENEWREMVFTDMSFLLKKIQTKLLKELADWREENINQLVASDKMSEIYNKTVIKLMNITFTQDQIYMKIRSNMYNTIKVDIKNMIEYDFEF
jgi:hypothetical protein